jgi:hypothetical protein
MLRRSIIVTSFALVFGVGALAFAQEPGGKGPGMKGQGRGPHPHITAAQQALTRAEKQLEEAANVYGGHKMKALELVKQAQKELRDGIEYAKARHKAPATKTQ